MEKRSNSYTAREVSTHNTASDLWIILGEDESQLGVYDVTKYHQSHPGGSDIMVQSGGTNAQDLFAAAEHSDKALSQIKKFCIGKIVAEEETVTKADSDKNCTIM